MKSALWQAVVLMLLGAGAGVVSHRFHPQAPPLYLFLDTQVAEGEITIVDALALEKSEGVLWVDARVRAEFEKGHVPGAILLNEQEWEPLILEAMETIARNDKTMIIYCDAQRCDANHQLAEKLRDLGQPDVRVLAGGWNAWKSAMGQ